MTEKYRYHGLISIVLLFLMMTGMCAMAQVSAAADSQGLDAAKHTKAEIINYIKAHPWNMDDVKYTIEPSVTQPYAFGEISAESSTSALNYLNIYRYIAGVDEASLDSTAMEYAQAASLAMAANNKLSHSVSRPSGMSDDMYQKAAYGAFNSNIAGSGSSLCNTILRYMLEVNGDQNFGHRRQLLKPYLSTTGFGSAKSVSGSYYSATYVDAYMKEDKAIAYPAQMQPIEYFGTDFAWTVIVPQKIDPASAEITVTNKKDGTVWKFRNASDDSSDYQYMRIDKDSTSACFIFAPEGIIYRDGDIYEVSITGIPRPITYEVNMFNIETIPVESVSISSYVPSTIVGRSVKGPGSVRFTPENASNKNMIWTSSDETIASVKNYGSANYEITGHKAGKVTITGIPEGGSGKIQFEFTVKPEPTEVDVPEEIVIGTGQSYLLKPKLLPEGCGGVCDLYSIDTSIAKLESSGSQKKVTGVKPGTTTIKVKVWYGTSTDETYDHLRKTITVTVVDPVMVTGLVIDSPDQADLGQQVCFTADIRPADATLKQVDWSSSSSSFKHLGNGVFAADTKPGRYTVTAKTKDGSGISESKEIIVYGKYQTPAAPKIISLSSTSVTLSNESGYTYEYTIDGTSWQTSRIFTGLKPNTEYTILQRAAENPKAYWHASDVSEPLIFTTPSCTHTWDNGVIETAATCTKEGRKLFTCTSCKATKIESIGLADHTIAVVKGKAATCTDTGLTDGKKCSECGAVFEEQQVIPAAGHSIGSHVGLVKATNKTKGNLEYWTCSRCGGYFSDAELIEEIKPEDTVIPKNAFKVTVKRKSFNIKAGRKTTIKAGKVYKVTKKKGKVTYKKSKGDRRITVAKNGKITVKKGLKKRTYKIKIKVTTSATELYKKYTRTVTVKIRVK